MKNLVFIFMCLFFVIPVQAEIIYVDENTPNNSDGSSWTNAYKFLQDALAASNIGDEIWVAQGTCRPDEDNGNPGGTGSRTATFQLINGVALYGGFPSGGGLWTSRNPDIYKTILSGDLNGDDGPDFANNGENSYNVVDSSGTDVTTILDGFTITAGNADGPGQYRQDMGGGMVNYESSLTVTNCTFSGNSAGWCGGGMFNDKSSPTLANCSFSGNSSDVGGSGIFNDKSSPTLTNCSFTGNSTSSTGGGMCNFVNSSPTLTNCSFTGNSAGGSSGGILNYNSSPTLTNCSFSDNSAGSIGGGMWNSENSSPVLTNCTFSGNSAQSAGGILNNYNSSPTITNCTFSNNSAKLGCGGGMCNWENSSSALTNCSFSDNSAGSNGGGIYNYNSSPTLTNCSFTGNSAGSNGGGMWNLENSNPVLTNCTFSENSAKDGCGITNWDYSSPALTNCILWGNTASDGPQMHNDDTSSTIVSYSDVQDSWPGTGNIDADPRFASPGYWDPNGTPADANDDMWVEGDYHLLPDSPCINTGDPNYIPEPNETDLDGNPRIKDGRIDMGAYETIQHEAYLSISPQVINRKSHQPRIMAWIRLPQGITKDQVDRDEPLILYPGGIESTRQFVIQSRGRSNRCTYVFAFFDKAELMDAIPENGWVELQVVGRLKPGQYYYGTDTVRIMAPRPRRRWPY